MAIPSLPIQTVRERTHLKVYCHRIGGNAKSVILAVSCVEGDGNLSVGREGDVALGASEFSVEIGEVELETLHKGLKVEMSTDDEGVIGGGVWKHQMGLDVVCVESFTRLLTLEEADISILYHRFGEFEDWHQWELHLWSEATREYEGKSAMVQAERPLRGGVARFDLAGVFFPQGVVVRAEMVRMSIFEGRTLVNENGEGYCSEDYRDASRRDVVREWVSGRAPTSAMHFVQGEKDIRVVGPGKAIMRNRWVRLRYRRHLPKDYEGWDLWTWDDADAECNGVVCLKIEGSQTEAWVDFELDRANYGSGAKIFVVPRRGGDEWLERDEPVRLWSSELASDDCIQRGREFLIAGEAVNGLSELEAYEASKNEKVSDGRDVSYSIPPKFCIVQGTSVVFRKLEEARSMLRAYVHTENSVLIKTPVPMSWISPPKRERSQTIWEVELKLCRKPASLLCQNQGHCMNNPQGKLLQFQKVQERSPTEWRLLFDKDVLMLDEDFPVENVVVSVPGFDAVPLSWERHEDWDKYLYEGLLGWEYDTCQCSFRCFAPTADQVSVVLYDLPTGEKGRRVVAMRRIPQGCWKAIVRGNLKGKYYKLLAEGENKRLFPGVEVIDPYSRCNTSHTGRGLIFGTEETRIHPRPNFSAEETIVYELHIRDLTIDKAAGVSGRGKFMGLTERGTTITSDNELTSANAPSLTDWSQEPMPGVQKNMQTLNKFSTGIDHIVQMGVNAVQLLPIQDFDNDESNDKEYKWGYMPVHFNSPDGWYASSTSTVARVTEFKQLVDAIHKAGLKVVMDVVYNHTAEDSNEFNIEARFSFNGIAPRYYYRTCGNTPVAYTGDSTCGVRKPSEARCGKCYSNGSGCGNEFRSESPMGRKFIIDSLEYWATEYMVDGFRFDLLGLVDVETLEQASSRLRNIDPNIIVYGEPWAGGLSPIRITEKGMQRSKGFGVFNNTFRDAIRGSPFGAEETFVIDGGRHSEVKNGIIGSIDDFSDSPFETINYVECHDNYTLWDHMRFYIRSRTDNIVFTEDDLRRMHRLAALIILTSQGIPFIQAGQEMCRTKFDVENSYESPDSINMIRWETKQTEWITVQYYRGLILLRRSHPEIFCKKSADAIRRSVVFFEDMGVFVPERCIAYRILGDSMKLYQQLQRNEPNADTEMVQEESRKWSQVVVLLNPTPSEKVFHLPGTDTSMIWIEFVNATHAGTRNLRCPVVGHVPIQGRSASLLRKASFVEEVDFRLMQRLAAVSDSYASFQGDDPLSTYAVGLTQNMSAVEAKQKKFLTARRREFEKNRKRRDDLKLFLPSAQKTEAAAIVMLDKLHERATQSTSSQTAGQ